MDFRDVGVDVWLSTPSALTVYQKNSKKRRTGPGRCSGSEQKPLEDDAFSSGGLTLHTPQGRRKARWETTMERDMPAPSLGFTTFNILIRSLVHGLAVLRQ